MLGQKSLQKFGWFYGRFEDTMYLDILKSAEL